MSVPFLFQQRESDMREDLFDKTATMFNKNKGQPGWFTKAAEKEHILLLAKELMIDSPEKGSEWAVATAVELVNEFKKQVFWRDISNG